MILGWFFLGFGCATARFKPDFLAAKDEITGFALLEPGVIIKKYLGNSTVFDFENENLIRKNIYKALTEHMGGRQIEYVEIPDERYDEYKKELEKAFYLIRGTKNIGEVKLDESFLKYLKDIDEKYVVIDYEYGFHRSGESLAKSSLAALIIGILTLGLFVPYPIQASSCMFLAIIDREIGRPVYYDSYPEAPPLDPLDYKTTSRQVKKILKQFNKGVKG